MVHESLSINFNLYPKQIVVNILYWNHLSFTLCLVTNGFRLLLCQLSSEIKYFCHVSFAEFGTLEDEGS